MPKKVKKKGSKSKKSGTSKDEVKPDPLAPAYVPPPPRPMERVGYSRRGF